MNVAAIISKNRISHFLVMARSLGAVAPNVTFFVLLIDDFSEKHLKAINQHFEVITNKSISYFRPNDLTNPDTLNSIYLRHRPLEIACIFKSLFCKFLLQKRSLESIIYCDSDLYFKGSPDHFLNQLEDSAGLFVPHRAVAQIEPTLSELYEESNLMTTGVFNLGFFGLKNQPTVIEFLTWWMNRMLLVCTRNSSAGLFDDQRWIDQAIVLFTDLRSFTDVGYNVANWNLVERKLEKVGQRYLVNQKPLIFFHFSGFDHTQKTFLCKYNNMLIADQSSLSELYQEYQEQVLEFNEDFPVDRPFSMTIEL